MGIDYGEVRIGIALSDPLRIISKPFEVIPNNQDIWKKIRSIVKMQNIGKIVIGLPVNLKGEDTKKTLEVRNFTKKFNKEIDIETVFWDERYSSAEANELLKKMGYSPQEGRKYIDKIAASLILKDYLENNK